MTTMTPRIAAPMVPTSATASVMAVVTAAGTAAIATTGAAINAAKDDTANTFLDMFKTPVKDFWNGAELHP
jgi:hypothetical protein